MMRFTSPALVWPGSRAICNGFRAIPQILSQQSWDQPGRTTSGDPRKHRGL